MWKVSPLIRFRRLLILAFFLPSLLYAQGVQYTHKEAGDGGTAVPYPLVTVCTSGAAYTPLPCTPKASIYSDAALTVPLANPFRGDMFGNIEFYATPGTYVLSVTAPYSPGYSFKVILGNAGDLLAKSGRPWFDVMAFGAKNDNTTDDTAAIQAAITAACATPAGGTIFFPEGAGYKTANTSTSPFTVSCNNLTFLGSAYPGIVDSPTLPPSTIYAPALTTDLFVMGGAGIRYGIAFRNMGIRGPCFVIPCVSFPSSRGINFGSAGNWILEHNFFDQWGSSAVVSSGGSGAWMNDNFAQGCLEGRPAVDTGCFDLTLSDVTAIANFASASSGTSAGQIGTGNSYAWYIRSGTGAFFYANQGDLSQHGWKISGQLGTYIGNRAFENQGNGFHVTTLGTDNTFIGNKSFTNSQTANAAYSAWLIDGQASRNTFDGNIVNCNGGNGNLMLNAFDDSNSNGAGDSVGNFYSANRKNSSCLTTQGPNAGVLYNFTGTSPYRVSHPTRNETQTIATGSLTLTPGENGEVQYFNTALSGNITLTLSVNGAWNGARFRLIRGPNASSSNNININGGAITTLTGINQYVDAEFLGGAWITTAVGVIPSDPLRYGVITQANQWAVGQSFLGITNNPGFQLFNTVTTCTTAAAIGATCTTAAITLPWIYSDTNYRMTCTGLGPTNVPVVQTYTKSNTTFTITIAALTAAAATFSSYDCTAVHN